MTGLRSKANTVQQSHSPCWQCLTAEPKQVLGTEPRNRGRAAYHLSFHAWQVCSWHAERTSMAMPEPTRMTVYRMPVWQHLEFDSAQIRLAAPMAIVGEDQERNPWAHTARLTSLHHRHCITCCRPSGRRQAGTPTGAFPI